MAQARFNGVVVAESGTVETIEGSLYFPPDSVRRDLLEPSDTRTACPWRGVARYYHVRVAGQLSEDAAWSYENPRRRARRIAGWIAFWKGVEVIG